MTSTENTPTRDDLAAAAIRNAADGAPVDSLAWLARRMRQAEAFYAKAREAFQHDAERDPEYAVKWKLDEVIAARVDRDVSKALFYRAVDAAHSGLYGPTEAEAVVGARRDVATQVLNETHLTNSTSLLSVAMGHEEVDARLKIARRMLAGGW